jgi:acetyltransferase-like isoleucine patch superfamily enzyme
MSQKTVSHGEIMSDNLRFLNEPILLSKLLEELSLSEVCITSDIYIKSVSKFSNEVILDNLQFTVLPLENEPQSLTLAPINSLTCKNIIKVENPKAIFFNIVGWLQRNIGFEPIFSTHISKTASIHSSACISDDVHIGEGTIIGPGVVIYPNVTIGDNCIVEANSVIGSAGFGVVQEKILNLMVPHIGGVIIGNDVRVGALTTIDRGTIGLTSIDEFTKIDDRVHIAHNCVIGKRNIICAGACIGGSVNVGNDCWLGLGCNIKQKVKIADGSSIGVGGNVFHNTSEQDKMVGYPVKKIPF